MITDKGGDKIHWAGEGELKGGVWETQWTFVKGTGKFEGIKGKGQYTAHILNPNQWYGDWELEVDLP